MGIVVEREKRKAAVAERMSATVVRARLRNTAMDGSQQPGKSNGSSAQTDDVEVDPPRRRTPELILGLLLVVGGALGALMLAQSGTSRVTVVATTRAIERGSIIERADLTALEVAADSARFMLPANDAGSMLGRYLLVDLPAGAPLAGHLVTQTAPLGATDALIPIALERSAVPGDLARGDMARAVMTFPYQGMDTTPPEMLETVMEVVEVVSPDEFASSVRVTVRAPIELALSLARAERVTLLKVAP